MDNYNLSQTGSEVQGILDKAAQLPDKQTLDNDFDAKQDVIPDLGNIRSQAQLGAQAYNEVHLAEQAAVNAQ